MPVKEITVTRWETSDGREFEYSDEAEKYEKEIPRSTFKQWHEDYPVQFVDSGEFHQEVPEEAMFSWLEECIGPLKDMKVFKDDH